MVILLVWWKAEFKFQRMKSERFIFRLKVNKWVWFFAAHLNWSFSSWTVQKLVNIWISRLIELVVIFQALKMLWLMVLGHFCLPSAFKIFFIVSRGYSSLQRGLFWSLSLEDFTSYLKTSWTRKLVSKGMDKSLMQSHLGRPVSEEWEETEHL